MINVWSQRLPPTSMHFLHHIQILYLVFVCRVWQSGNFAPVTPWTFHNRWNSSGCVVCTDLAVHVSSWERYMYDLNFKLLTLLGVWMIWKLQKKIQLRCDALVYQYIVVVIMNYKALSGCHTRLRLYSFHGVVKILESPCDRREIKKFVQFYIIFFTKRRCRGVLMATEAFLRSSRGVYMRFNGVLLSD